MLSAQLANASAAPLHKPSAVTKLPRFPLNGTSLLDAARRVIKSPIRSVDRALKRGDRHHGAVFPITEDENEPILATI